MLPIEHVLPEILFALDGGKDVILSAPPGAGKTTLVPLRLLDAPWRDGKRILMLEPRRLAARAAARRMAHLLGEEVGRRVGYRVRLESRVGPETIIEVVTEGILTRMLQSDPSLGDVACILFDEFHERSIHADLALALTLEARAAFRDDVRVVIMSATLDDERLGQLLPEAAQIRSEGRLFDVDTHYSDSPLPEWPADAVAGAVRRALSDTTDGDVLVFLPGQGEIMAVRDRLDSMQGVDVLPLFGALSFAEQDRAMAASPAGRRKVVLATDIAETSLTIEGVRVVVDSGIRRVPLFDPASGMTRLVTRPISQASANQRRGRAGRTAPGVCYRLWTRLEQEHKVPFDPPEILGADLASLALELACWGVDDASTLTWLDPPPRAAMRDARGLLALLRALDTRGRVTPHGRDLARMAAHPRLAHMMRSAADARQATVIAAILTERDFVEHTVRQSDMAIRVDAVLGGRAAVPVVTPRLKRVQQVAKDLGRHAGKHGTVTGIGSLVASAYPDRIAQRVDGEQDQFRLRSGQLCSLHGDDVLHASPFLAVASLGGRSTKPIIFLAAALTEAEVRDVCGEDIEMVQVVTFDAGTERVEARRQEVCGGLILASAPLSKPDAAVVAEEMLRAIRERGHHVLPWSKETEQLRDRLAFLSSRDPSWPSRKLEAAREWLLPMLDGMRSFKDLKRLDMREALLYGLDWARRQELERRAPERLEVPSGSRIAIDYSDPSAPVLAVRLQEVFGMQQTPAIDDGRAPLVVHLLSPAHRPIQVTSDLAGFWTSSYADVRKDMRGQYPKHQWPEDPLSATPTARTTKRRR